MVVVDLYNYNDERLKNKDTQQNKLLSKYFYTDSKLNEWMKTIFTTKENDFKKLIAKFLIFMNYSYFSKTDVLIFKDLLISFAYHHQTNYVVWKVN